MTESDRPPPAGNIGECPTADENDLARRLAFLELGDDDARRLRELGPQFSAGAEEFVEQFYRHLLAFDETARFLQTPELVQRLKHLQREHLESLFEGRWDAEFLYRRRRVGQAHAESTIEPLFFLGAYYQFVRYFITGIVARNEGDDADERTEQLLTVLKAVFLDVGLTLESYFTKLTQDLRQALDIVWKANDELRQFARLASHDLKTPLGTVANLCDEALDEFGGDMPTEAGKLIEAAKQTVYRMSTTIDELLSATISTNGSDSIDDVAGSEVIRDAIERVRPELDKRKVEVVISEPLPVVAGNKAQLREAFFNLVSNAAKYIDKDPARIEVGCELRDEDCVFCVADNGPGIPANELTQIFAPFRRLPMHRDYPGSGLGLYFAKNLVEQLGGRIWADSEPGEGSRFYVELRLSRPQS